MKANKKNALLFGASVAVALSGMFSSCDNNKRAVDSDGNPVPTTSDSLKVALANQDSLLILMNEISESMSQIRSVEKIVSVSNMNSESVSRREQLKSDIISIRQTLEERRAKLEELEKKFKNSSYNNSLLNKSIESLKAQIAQQEEQIATLRDELAKANIVIGELKTSVDSLNTTVSTVSEERDKAQLENANLVNEMNTVHYLVGTSKELKATGVLKNGGFLRKAKLNTAEFDMSRFTTADKRNLKTIPLYSKKAKVLTSQPADSYSITDEGGEKVLNITNPTKFWNASDYLVIQID